VSVEEARPTRDIVVIGASAGGVEAMTRLVRALPPDFAAAVYVVLHVPPTGSALPQILGRAGALAAAHARDGDPIVGGVIFVAPPDLHLLLDPDGARLIRGPRENGHRPAIDPLFRSAAHNHGPRVIGVVLSGSLDDGAAGLATIKQAGGMTIVQDPAEAVYPTMPASAISVAHPDHILPVAGIAELLRRVTGPRGPDPAQWAEHGSRSEGNTMESDPTARTPEAVTEENRQCGRITSFTCPECSGTLWELQDGDLVKLRCRVGHAFTEEAYSHEQALAIEAALWTAMTALIEKADFARRLESRFERSGHEISARRYADLARNSREQAELVHQALMNLRSAPMEEDEERQAS
jgi:two-component system, chemotaxis family, protein-glutamate methylesterase/glutaminase